MPASRSGIRVCKRLRRDLSFGQRIAELLNDIPRYVVSEVLAEAADLERALTKGPFMNDRVELALAG
jgi:hypothetical protein